MARAVHITHRIRLIDRPSTTIRSNKTSDAVCPHHAGAGVSIRDTPCIPSHQAPHETDTAHRMRARRINIRQRSRVKAGQSSGVTSPVNRGVFKTQGVHIP